MNKKITYRVVSPTRFIDFLSRFSAIEPTLLVEIEDGEMKAKTYTADRAVVKFSKIGLNEAFDVIDGNEENLMFGLVSIDKFASSLKNFKDGSFDMTVEYAEIEGKNVGTKITVHNKRLTLDFDCASFRLFTHISDELFNEKIAEVNGNYDATFIMTNESFSEISAVSKIDADYKLISLSTANNQVRAKGKMFDLQVVESVDVNETAITFYKHHFGLVEREDSLVQINSDKLVFTSSESETTTVVGSSDDDA